MRTLRHASFSLLILAATMATAAFVNDPALPFELSTLDGQKYRFDPGKGGVTLVNFWASWCPPCKDEFPKLNQLAADYAGKDVEVIAVTLDKAAANVNNFLEKHGTGKIRLRILRDPDGRAAKAYAARAMPMSYVVDRKGKIRFAHMGFQPNDEMKWRQEIDALLAEGDK